MSYTGSLSHFYRSSFIGCAALATSPYLLTMNLCVDFQNPKFMDIALGISTCVFFSTAVPVLLAISALTFAVATFAAKILCASMFIAYPIAVISDLLKPSPAEYVFR